jgi:hypothetical protein
MNKAEKVKLFDVEDKLFEVMELPAGYMEDAEKRSVIVEGRKFVEGGADSFYGRGEFAEVQR